MISAENEFAIDNQPLSEALPSDQIGFNAFVIIPLLSKIDYCKLGFDIQAIKDN